MDGERVDVRGRGRSRIEAEHLVRYEWAAKRVSGRVLDVACGTGYGSALLGDVVGVDRDEEAIEAARVNAPNGEFIVAELPELPFGDDEFDCAVCFETIEHVGDDQMFIRELSRVLVTGGLLLLSTPNRATSPSHNRWHVREYLLDELHELLTDADFGIEATHWQSEQRPIAFAYRLYARFPVLQDMRNPLASLPFGPLDIRPGEDPRAVYLLVEARKTHPHS